MLSICECFKDELIELFLYYIKLIYEAVIITDISSHPQRVEERKHLTCSVSVIENVREVSFGHKGVVCGRLGGERGPESVGRLLRPHGRCWLRRGRLWSR